MNRLRFLVSRLVQTLAVLVVITFITFAIFEFFPADPAQLACDNPCTPENLALARSYMSLNDPWYQQFWNYLSGIVAGTTYGSGADAIHCSVPCLGYSFRLSTPVTELIANRLPVTMSVALGGSRVVDDYWCEYRHHFGPSSRWCRGPCDHDRNSFGDFLTGLSGRSARHPAAGIQG